MWWRQDRWGPHARDCHLPQVICMNMPYMVLHNEALVYYLCFTCLSLIRHRLSPTLHWQFNLFTVPYIYYTVSHACDFPTFALYPPRPHSSAYSYPLKVRTLFWTTQASWSNTTNSYNTWFPYHYIYHTTLQYSYVNIIILCIFSSRQTFNGYTSWTWFKCYTNHIIWMLYDDIYDLRRQQWQRDTNSIENHNSGKNEGGRRHLGSRSNSYPPQAWKLGWFNKYSLFYSTDHCYICLSDWCVSHVVIKLFFSPQKKISGKFL